MSDSILANRKSPGAGTRIREIFRTLWQVLVAMRDNKLQALIPVVLFLFLISFLMYFINLMSPIAPFVYSLF